MADMFGSHIDSQEEFEELNAGKQAPRGAAALRSRAGTSRPQDPRPWQLGVDTISYSSVPPAPDGLPIDDLPVPLLPMPQGIPRDRTRNRGGGFCTPANFLLPWKFPAVFIYMAVRLHLYVSVPSALNDFKPRVDGKCGDLGYLLFNFCGVLSASLPFGTGGPAAEFNHPTRCRTISSMSSTAL
eukprot:167758-Prorocentrum_minimum.AAC.2